MVKDMTLLVPCLHDGDQQGTRVSEIGGNAMLDLDKIRLQANAYASTYDCKIDRVDTTFTMSDEDGTTSQMTVTDGGEYKGRQMMVVKDDEGEMLIEAFGQLLAKIMYS